MTIGAYAMAGTALVRMGRFAEAERHLARAEDTLRLAADLGTEVVLHHPRGMLRFGEGHFDEALAAFARAHGLQRRLASEHVFTFEARARALQVRVRMGDTEAARLALSELSADQRRLAATASRSRHWSSKRTTPTKPSRR